MGAWGECEEDVIISGSGMESKVVVFLQRGGSAKEETVSVSGGTCTKYICGTERLPGDRGFSQTGGEGV